MIFHPVQTFKSAELSIPSVLFFPDRRHWDTLPVESVSKVVVGIAAEVA